MPEERSWTTLKNGKSIWDMDEIEDDDDESLDAIRDLDECTRTFSQGMSECRRLLKSGQVISDNLSKYL
jgi:hypothetical protein